MGRPGGTYPRKPVGVQKDLLRTQPVFLIFWSQKCLTMASNRNENEKYTFVKDDKLAWVPAIIIKQECHTVHVKVPEYQGEQSTVCDGGEKAVGWEECMVQLDDYRHQQLPIQNVDENGKMQSFPDMIDFEHLHEVRATNCKVD